MKLLNQIIKVSKKDPNYDLALKVITKKSEYDLKQASQFRKKEGTKWAVK